MELVGRRADLRDEYLAETCPGMLLEILEGSLQSHPKRMLGTSVHAPSIEPVESAPDLSR